MQTTSNRPVAVVTGASTGFGRLTAEALARGGYRTYAGIREPAGRNAAPARELAALGIAVIDLDVTSDASVDAAARRVLDETGRVDVLVNNAGAAYFGIVESFTPALAQRQFDINVFGVLRVNRAFLPAMRAQKSGLVVFVSSVIGRFLAPFTGIYAASKHALEALAETSAYELRPSGIDVTIVQPSAYKTSIFATQIFGDDEARAASYGDLATKPRELAAAFEEGGGDPHEVADAIVELAERAPGTRPLRRIVGDASVAGPVNAALAPVQTAVLENFGMSAFAPAQWFDHAEPAKAG